MKVLIIDYGMGNLGSISRAVEECGGEYLISDNPKKLEEADKIILPGVGSFRDGIENLNLGGWVTPLKSYACDKKIPLLGICLGMQLLADKGSEGGETVGLGLINGQVQKLEPKSSSEKIPHIGWNNVDKAKEDKIFESIPDRSDFYFVHSYHFVPKDKKDILAVTPYCGKFVSVVGNDNIYGTQFHPEKSSNAGFQLLKNFLNL